MIEFIMIVAGAVVGFVLVFTYAWIILFLTLASLVVYVLFYPVLSLFDWLLRKWRDYRSNKR